MNKTKNIARASLILAIACMISCFCTLNLRIGLSAIVFVLAYNVAGVRYTILVAILISIYQLVSGLYPNWLIPYSIIVLLSNVVYVLSIHYIRDESNIFNVIIAASIKMFVIAIACIISINTVLYVLILSYSINELIFSLLGGGYAGYKLTSMLEKRKFDTVTTL